MKAVEGFPHIYKRGQRYVYKRAVPADVRSALAPARPRRNGGPIRPRVEWRIALQTTRLEVAERKAALLAAEHDRIIAHVRSGQDAIEADAREITAMGQAEVYDHLRFASEMFGDRDNWPDHLKALAEILENGGKSTDPLPLSKVYETDLQRHRAAGGSRSEKPIEAAVTDFLTVVGDTGIREIKYADVDTWISAMRKRKLAPATIRRRLGAVGERNKTL